MKVQKIEGIHGFDPFDIIFTVENEEEARGLFAIFNYYPNVTVLPNGKGKEIRSIIGDNFGKLDNGEIANGVNYRTFYNAKKE